MSLFENWDESEVRNRNTEDYSDEDSKTRGPALQAVAETPEQAAIFAMSRLDWEPTAEQGTVVSIAIANDVLLVATSMCYVIRWNVENNDFEEMLVSRKTEDKIYKVFIDPSGHHGIISLTNGTNYYLHSNQKPKLFSKIKNVVIESVAWDKYNTTEKTTSRFLIGSKKGIIFEASIEDGKDTRFTQVFDLSEGDQKDGVAVSGMQIDTFPSSVGAPNGPKYFVMIATLSRVYQMIGGPTFEALFEQYRAIPSFLEVPGHITKSELHFYAKYGNPPSTAKAAAWLTGAGVFHGPLVFGSENVGDKLFAGELLDYPSDVVVGRNDSVVPVSLILTEFHFILLYPNRVMAINQLSKDIVYDEVLDAAVYGTMRGLAPDPTKGTVWMFSDRFVFEVMITQEDREVWRFYLEKGQYDTALQYAHTAEQKQIVLNHQADHYFNLGNFDTAAEKYAQTQRSFEEVALKFVNSKAPTALKSYLLNKLRTLPPGDLTQQVMVCTWVTEIYLDELTGLKEAGDSRMPGAGSRVSTVSAYDAADHAGAYNRVETEFYSFLEDYNDVLNKNTTMELISSHGRIADLLYYAKLTGDWEFVLSHHIQKQEYDQALQLLSTHDNPSRIEELYYKFAPTLIQHRPRETVQMMMKLRVLDPTKLLPALMRYESTRHEEAEVKEKGGSAGAGAGSKDNVNYAIKYLEYCISSAAAGGGNKEPAVHNYLVSLYVKLDDEQPLLAFIKSQAERPYYDYKYALRLCHQANKNGACVEIYRHMRLFEDAVRLALTMGNLALAKDIVKSAPRDDGRSAEDELELVVAQRGAGEALLERRRRLWLMIARDVIQRASDATKAMEILKETDLKIEDVLPFFPDFVKIGSFKDEICQSLEAYNRTVDKLKDEMKEYTKSANLIRKDISELRNRSGFVTANQKCDVCSQPVLTRQFYLFPCTHVYHADCITSQVRSFLNRHPKLRQEVLAASGVKSDGKDASSSRDEHVTLVHVGLPPRIPASADSKTPAADKGPPLLDRLGTSTSLLAGMGDRDKERERERERQAALERQRKAAEAETAAVEQFASGECILCGKLMIESVMEPFVNLPEEQAVASTWEV